MRATISWPRRRATRSVPNSSTLKDASTRGVGHRAPQQLVGELLAGVGGDVPDEAPGEGVAGAGGVDHGLQRVGGQREEALGG